ncbi:outer membrane receptor protein involved in Fe transport [Pseudomonas sp. PvP001]
MKPQKATTAELGVRASAGIFDGSLTLYRSWIDDEILSVVVRQASASQDQLVASSNASPTIHQGVEAGLNALLWEGDNGDTLNLRQAYTFNDFYYRHDNTFGGNELPSLPRHVY